MASHPRPPPRAAVRASTAAAADGESATAPVREWWMLLHQLPPDPPGLRMRVWRRLQDLGALQIKGSVYVLPATEAAREDLQWLLGEIRAAGAEASLWLARSVEGLSDSDLVLRFQATAAADYEDLESEARDLRDALKRERSERRAATRPTQRSGVAAKRSIAAPRVLASAEARKRLAKLRARFEDIARRDYFEAPRREVVGALLVAIEHQLQESAVSASNSAIAGTLDRGAFRARTWVTRANVHVDRMASAWLIQRFIDPEARFVFSDDARRSPVPGGLRFDMYEGEFGHEGDLCTFEVLQRRFGLHQPGLERIAQMIHDIDLKEVRYGHAETSGVAASLDAIAAAAPDDPARVAMAGTVLDGLLQRFARGPSA